MPVLDCPGIDAPDQDTPTPHPEEDDGTWPGDVPDGPFTKIVGGGWNCPECGCEMEEDDPCPNCGWSGGPFPDDYPTSM